MASMAVRIDSFEEDVETLYMAMGGARNPAALLVGIVKTMEDGEFKPRDAESRAQFRRAKELKQEAVEAQTTIKGVGSIRQRFMEQQKRHNKQLEANRNSPERGRKRDNKRDDSRDRGRRSRSRSRSRGGRGGGRDSERHGDDDRRGNSGYHKWPLTPSISRNEPLTLVAPSPDLCA